MINYLVVSIISGLLFGVLDGLINANPFARRLNEVYRPIARTNLNLPAGLIIDLVYGFVLAGIFLFIYSSLPGEIGLVKGLSFGLLAWFLRVVMSTVSNWMMFKIPFKTLLYALLTGLGEMLVLGIIYGLFLKPLSLFA